jgi:hypothetical protein
MNKTQTVEQARQNGIKVKIQHFRLTNDGNVVQSIKGESGLNYATKGGSTRVKVINGGVEAVAVATCSKNDNFSRKLGSKIALGRALTKLAEKIESKKVEAVLV